MTARGTARSWPLDAPHMFGPNVGLRRRLVILVLIYAGAAVTIVAMGNLLLRALVRSADLLECALALKDLSFVALSTGLVYTLLQRAVGLIEDASANAERTQAERLRRDEELAQSSAIIHFADDAIISKSLNGIIKTWNPAAERMFGYAAAEIVGRSIELLIPPDRAEEEPMILRRIKAGERIERFETVRVRKDGSFVPVEITVSPTWDRDLTSDAAVRIIGASKILRDITKRKDADDLAARERRFARGLIEAMPGIFYLYDEQRQLLRWNENLERVSGYAPAEVRQLDPFALFARDNREALEQQHADVIAFGEASVEATFVAKDGRCTPYFLTGKRIVFDDSTCLAGVGVDITKRKQAERSLRDAHDNLERKVAERTRDLEAARERAEAADQLKSAFLATMSHELRTPLNSILGFTGIILQELAGPLNPEQSKQLGMVQGSARHLLSLINDVLDLSKIEAGQLSLQNEPFDLQLSIKRVTELIAPLADKKSLCLRVVAPVLLGVMQGDQRRVEQILINLLNNAVKFTERGEVTLSVEIVHPEPNAPGASLSRARIRITDTGIGMQPQDLSKLFQPFRQIDSGLQRQHEGTGLGLAICRRLTDLLGGTIGAESVFGTGSVFTVELPMRRSCP
jgi:PAS domain S-box-containing protein